MRRILAVLALLATSWPHVVVLECALGSAAPRAATEAAAHHGVGHEHVPVPAAETDEEAPVGGLECGMVMACGLVMIQAQGEVSGEVASAAPQRAAPRTLAAPSVADLAADPPPPRGNA